MGIARNRRSTLHEPEKSEPSSLSCPTEAQEPQTEHDQGSALLPVAPSASVQTEPLPSGEWCREEQYQWCHGRPSPELLLQIAQEIISRVAAIRDCDDEPDQCFTESAAFCGTHGDNYKYRELFCRARLFLVAVGSGTSPLSEASPSPGSSAAPDNSHG